MLIQNLQKDFSVSDTLLWKNYSLWYKDHLYICKKYRVMKNIILELHTSAIGGNLQFLKMYSKIKIIFFGKVLNLMFKRFVEECLIFQQNKVETINLPSLLQPFEIRC